MEQLQREVQSLTDKMKAMHAGGGKKKKNKSGNSKGQTTPNPGITQVKGGKRKNKGKATISNNAGTITLNRKERIMAVEVGNKTGNGMFDIKPSNFTFLKQFSMFDRVKWNKLVLTYRPGVGTTFNGMISYGVLWDFSKSAASRDQISALTPNTTHALWYDGTACPMVLPRQKLQSRPWFTPVDSDAVEQAPGRIFWAADTPDVVAPNKMVVGEFWAEYSVTLTGTGFS
uniref:Capsid protein n=1 Tax=Mortimer virus TaxID=2600330 RepID=A0A5B8XAJ0_9VIRU|nr:hypothetical protein 3 [Mortimer virus]